MLESDWTEGARCFHISTGSSGCNVNALILMFIHRDVPHYLKLTINRPFNKVILIIVL